VSEFEACGIAAFLLGKAGEKLAEKSESITPQMLAREIPKLIRELLR
jgi:NAD(P)H-hydrate repair Nnr-like enzyme with NAD(P)H-hydrate dehydratase domain